MRMVQVMLVFSRDEWVEQNAAASSQKQFALSTQVLSDLPCILHIIFLHNLLHQHYYDYEFSMQLGQKIGGIFPPCGVVPFRGLVLYVTPLCFLFDALEDLYVSCDV
jgi:hypothetical protein